MLLPRPSRNYLRYGAPARTRVEFEEPLAWASETFRPAAITAPMRICALHNNFYRSSGSAAIIRRIYDAFQGTPVEFFFAGCGAPTEGGAQAEEDLSWMPDGRYEYFNLMGAPSALPAEMARFVRWLRRNDCDLIHVHHRRLAALVNIARSCHRRPILFTAHNTFPWALWFWALGPNVMSGVSPSVVNYLKLSSRVKCPLLTWNPCRFSTEEPRPKDLSLASNAAISVGRLEPVKGHLNLILAWKKLQSFGLRPHLNIFGEGHLRDQLQATIRSEGLRDRVHLRGFGQELEKEFASSLFNVLGSHAEGFPNVVVEAAASNTGSLLTDVDGSRDTVPPDVLLPNKVKVGDVDSMAEYLAAWFKNPRAAARDGRTFRSFLSARCSMSAVRNTYAGIYAHLSA